MEGHAKMNQLNSEWIKFRSLKSNWIVLGIMLLASMVGPGMAAYTTSPFRAQQIAFKVKIDWEYNATWDTVSNFTQGYIIFAAILVILMTSQEFHFGTIQVAVFTHPNRVSYYGWRLAFVSIITVVSYIATTFAGFAAAYIGQRGLVTDQPFFTEFFECAGLVYGQVLLAVWLTMIIIAGLVFIFRSSTPAILTFFAIYFVVPTVLLVVFETSSYNWYLEPVKITSIPVLLWVIAYLPSTCFDSLMGGLFDHVSMSLGNFAENFNLSFSADQYFITTAIVYGLIALAVALAGCWVFKRHDI
jgi:hypothetical protein